MPIAPSLNRSGFSRSALGRQSDTLIYLWPGGTDFARFDAHLKSLGYLAMGGQIMDASIIAAPRQRLTDEERAIVKDGGIWADSLVLAMPPAWLRGLRSYRSQKNERAILRAKLVSKIQFRRSPGKPLPAQRQRANAARSKICSAVEHVFATQKHRMNLFIRTIGIERAKAKIGLANIAFNFKRFLYWQTQPSTA